jgi:AraC-like DNA-binding protein
LIALAEQVLGPSRLCPFLEEMYAEARCMEIVGEVLARLGDGQSSPRAETLTTHDTMKARAARDFIEANLDRALSLTDIARAVGASVTVLQRRFKSVYGTTVVQFLHARKLEQARDALERGAVTITEAAYLAGYSSPANFTTAFRRAYGILPKSLRR